MSEKYVRLCKGLQDKGILVKESEVEHKINDQDEWYTSVFLYNQNQYEQFKSTGTIKGVNDVTTNKIWFDLDNKENPESARKDSVEIVNRLKKAGIKEKNIQVYFSGNKGIHLVVLINKYLTPKKVQNICKYYGKGIKTLDLLVYNASRILRVPGTKHAVSGMYKYPLTIRQLETLSMDQIRKLASSLGNIEEKFGWDVEDLPESILEVAEEVEVTEKKPMVTEYDKNNKPKHWPDYKWALLNAVALKPEERHHSVMVLAATCRGLGYPREMAEALLLTFDQKFQAVTGKDPIEDLDQKLDSVYSTAWNGGTYSFKNDPWLQEYCERIGIKPEKEEETTINIDQAFSLFKDYASNIDKITIKSGIKSLDERLRMTIGMLVYILAGPGVGKTSLALQILNSMSKRDEHCIFFSYDMYHSLVFQKLVQKHLGKPEEVIFKNFKEGNESFQKQAVDTLKEEYKNVDFCFKVGQTPEDIERTILETEAKTGKKPRLIVVDYNELVMSDMSDPTQSTAYVTHKLNAIAKNHNICVITLVQPNKMAGSPSDELKSYRSIKGSSSIEQSAGIILGMSRPGYDPRTPGDDKFITINCLKNRMGPLFSLDLGWDGMRGDIYELSDEQEAHLAEIRNRKKEEEATKKPDGWT